MRSSSSAQPAPLLSVFGGKITTYRRLAEDAVNCSRRPLGCVPRAWTARATLPGRRSAARQLCGVPAHARAALPVAARRAAAALRACLRHAPRARARRRRCARSDLGEQILPQLYERELEYLCREEFARSAEDILWRRSKLGLHLLKADSSPLERWLAAKPRETARVARRRQRRVTGIAFFGSRRAAPATAPRRRASVAPELAAARPC